MKQYDRILLSNKAWAKEKVEEDPDFFTRGAKIQKPGFLWIGCSDSRVPPSQIIQADPGELFIHRNIANVVMQGDINMLSVLQFSVEELEVEDVILCGHYGCGGVTAALKGGTTGPIDEWLKNIRKVQDAHKEELDAIEDEDDRIARLIEFNVKDQLIELAKTDIIQKAWKTGERPALHGWVYDLHDGHIKRVLELDNETDLDAIDTVESPIDLDA
ncbi:MAG: carbonic anhydrase [Pseudomonadota bacterium]